MRSRSTLVQFDMPFPAATPPACSSACSISSSPLLPPEERLWLVVPCRLFWSRPMFAASGTAKVVLRRRGRGDSRGLGPEEAPARPSPGKDALAAAAATQAAHPLSPGSRTSTPPPLWAAASPAHIAPRRRFRRVEKNLRRSG